ncbi:MAG: hypothetical protein Q4B70_02075 [Lachnospiraceae bacterium]|nr:hypothetical protein [Lachnospiraceae bacterium]
MKKELEHFWIGEAYGGSQDWFLEFMMRKGGCAAQTACDSALYFAKHFKKTKLYPYNEEQLTKADYVSFSGVMKPYLRPRMSGVNTLALYIEGFGDYLNDRGETEVTMTPLPGETELSVAKEAVIFQIDHGYPIPCLILKHKNSAFEDYVWHWFLLNGYEQYEDRLMVKAVTYGEWEWLSFEELWDTGYRQKGGLVLYGQIEKERKKKNETNSN